MRKSPFVPSQGTPLGINSGRYGLFPLVIYEYLGDVLRGKTKQESSGRRNAEGGLQRGEGTREGETKRL